MFFLFFDVAPLMSYGKKTDFPHALPFILGFSCHARARGALLLAEFLPE